MTTWYYADSQRRRQGPVPAAELNALFQRNTVALDTLVWREGLAQWQPLRDFTDELGLLQPAPAAMPPPPPSAVATGSDSATAADAASPAADAIADERPTHGRAVFTAAEPSYQAQRDADQAYHSPYTPPSAELASHGAVVHGGSVVLAGFWKRVAASIIDSFIVALGGGVIGAVIGGIIGAMFGLNGGLGAGGSLLISGVTNLLSIAVTAGYYAYFHSSTQQATLGKMAIGIKVVRGDGEPISLARGIGRYFATWLSSIILGIGFLMAAFTERKQALHDMVCDTLVVDKWAYTEHPEWQREELGTVTVVILAIFGLLMLLVVAALVLGVGAAIMARS